MVCCEKCKWRRYYDSMHICTHDIVGKVEIPANPVYGRQWIYTKCLRVNENNDCRYYEEEKSLIRRFFKFLCF